MKKMNQTLRTQGNVITTIIDGEEVVLIAGGDGSGGDGSGDAGTGGEGSGDGGAAVATFSQEQVNQLISSNKKETKKENETLRTQISELTGQMTSISDLVKTLTANGNGSNDGDPLANIQVDHKEGETPEITQMRKLLKFNDQKSQKQIDTLKSEVESGKKETASANTKRLNSVRDTQLLDALVKNGCVDPDSGLKLFRDQMSLGEDGEWTYTAKNGVELPLEEGISADLPKYMKRSQASGGSGGKTPKAQLTSEIEAQKNKVTELKTKAQGTNNNSDIMAVTQAQRKLRELESDLSNRK